MLAHMRDRQPELLAGIKESRDLDDEARAKLSAAVEEFKDSFRPSEV